MEKDTLQSKIKRVKIKTLGSNTDIDPEIKGIIEEIEDYLPDDDKSFEENNLKESEDLEEPDSLYESES